MPGKNGGNPNVENSGVVSTLDREKRHWIKREMGEAVVVGEEGGRGVE